MLFRGQTVLKNFCGPSKELKGAFLSILSGRFGVSQFFKICSHAQHSEGPDFMIIYGKRIYFKYFADFLIALPFETCQFKYKFALTRQFFNFLKYPSFIFRSNIAKIVKMAYII
jgi:hypothetical protein